MNIRNVLSVYTKLRQFNDDESALLETLRGLNDAERESLVVALQPEKSSTKRASKKASSKSSTKSPRAQSLSGAIQRAGKLRTIDDEEEERCTVQRGDLGGTVCGLLPDHNVHQMRSVRGYHPFVSASDAASAGEGSSPKEAYTLSVPSLGTDADAAPGVAASSNETDARA